MDLHLLLAVLLGIGILLLLILVARIPAFISLLIASISVGLIAGLSGEAIMKGVQQGMAGTLGFVATVVGLGAMFGAILEHSGGARAIADFTLRKSGEKRAPIAMVLTGFLVAIPVFFDVAFIILVPMIYALQRKTKKSLLLYAIPLLAGLAITHAFIPPTPGPIAVADIIDAELGWVILCGFLVGIPTAIISGPIFSRFIASKIHLEAPPIQKENESNNELPHIGIILFMIVTPIFLILFNTLLNSPICDFVQHPLFEQVRSIFKFIGHPFAALIIANLLAWYFLGIRRGVDKKRLLDIINRSMAPAGTIILLTGAGGVFKQMLVDTGAGTMLAESLISLGIPLLVFGFITAALIRIIQGSATVAMITAAGILAPLLVAADYSAFDTALMVIAIASGASILSHVNDSGFWLVSQYLGMSEKQTFRSWTMMTTVLALSGFVFSLILFLVF